MRWRDVGWVQRSRRARRALQTETQEPSKVPAPPPTLRPTTLPYNGRALIKLFPTALAISKDKNTVRLGEVRVMIAVFTGAKTFHETRLDLANLTLFRRVGQGPPSVGVLRGCASARRPVTMSPPTHSNMLSLEQKMATLQLPSGSMTDRSTCSTTRSEYGRDPNRRVAGALTLEQEEALLGLMYDHFQMSDCQTLDLETVMRCALTLQCDPDVCKALGAQPVPMEEAWLPEQDWVTDMCFAFTDAGSQLTARSKPSGMVTPEGISYLVAQAIMTDLQSAPAADPGAIPPPAVLVPVTAIPSSAENARSTSRKNSKKKSTKKDVSDADLLADPRSQRKATPTKPKATPKPKKSPKRGATPREVTI